MTKLGAGFSRWIIDQCGIQINKQNHLRSGFPYYYKIKTKVSMLTHFQCEIFILQRLLWDALLFNYFNTTSPNWFFARRDGYYNSNIQLFEDHTVSHSSNIISYILEYDFTIVSLFLFTTIHDILLSSSTLWSIWKLSRSFSANANVCFSTCTVMCLFRYIYHSLISRTYKKYHVRLPAPSSVS